MARFRIAQPAQSDLANLLATSAERWGTDGRRRYALLLAAAIRTVAANPEHPLTQPRNELAPRLRSFHLRHARINAPQAKVKKPVHVLYYRAIQSGVIEIVRVLHERMETKPTLRRGCGRRGMIMKSPLSRQWRPSLRALTEATRSRPGRRGDRQRNTGRLNSSLGAASSS